MVKQLTKFNYNSKAKTKYKKYLSLFYEAAEAGSSAHNNNNKVVSEHDRFDS